MTWRQFLAHVNGLSPMSAFLNAVNSRAENRQVAQQGDVITDPAAGERAVLNLIHGG